MHLHPIITVGADILASVGVVTLAGLLCQRWRREPMQAPLWADVTFYCCAFGLAAIGLGAIWL